MIVLVVWAAGCDSAPGPSPLHQRPPSITEFAYAPDRVVYALVDPAAIEGDSVHITLSMAATVVGPDVPIDRVEYAVLTPDFDPIAAGMLAFQGNGRYQGDAAVTISALEVRNYTVLVFAVDQAEQISGEARGVLAYVRSFEPSLPPVIEALDIPDSVQRPGTGQPARSLFLIARVSDPDGQSDIERVEFWNQASPQTRFAMCDDGNRRPCGSSLESGDAVAEDSLYTRRVFITVDNALGANTLVFEAIDRAGLRSAQHTHTVTVTN